MAVMSRRRLLRIFSESMQASERATFRSGITDSDRRQSKSNERRKTTVIKIDWTVWLQAANFLVLLFVLQAVLYRPLRDLMARRQARQDGAAARARQLDEDTARRQTAYRGQLEEARTQARADQAELLAAAHAEETRLLNEAPRDAGETLRTIRQGVAEQLAPARRLVRDRAGELSRAMAARILGRPL
jgi:F-type H+-transporting ATPase subunit b